MPFMVCWGFRGENEGMWVPGMVWEGGAQGQGICYGKKGQDERGGA